MDRAVGFRIDFMAALQRVPNLLLVNEARSVLAGLESLNEIRTALLRGGLLSFPKRFTCDSS